MKLSHRPLHLAALWLALLAWLGFSTAALGDTDSQAPASPAGFEQLVRQLPQGSLPQRAETIARLGALDDPRVIEVLTALQDGQLQADRSAPPRVAVRRGGQLQDVLTGEPVQDSAGFRRVPVNNSLRSQLRTLLAQLNLNHEDARVRYEAVRRFIRDGIDQASIALLEARQAQEESGLVNGAIDTALALYQLNHGSPAQRLEAVDALHGSLEQEARNALTALASHPDTPTELREAAEAALRSIAGRISFYRFIENLTFGLSLGSILLLAAIGLAITFGVMGVINMAHGELIMLGAYTTWGVQQLFPGQPGLALILSIPAGFLVAALAGIAIERSVIQYLKGRPLETLLATFGISLILQQLVRTVISPLNRSVVTPEWMSGSIMVNEALSLTLNRLYVIGFALVVFAGLMLIMRKTRLGLEVRAVTQNRAMARSMGIKATKVDIMTFALGSGVAGLAGVALSQITNVGPNLGQNYIIDSFMVVVFGGVGNLWGTLIAGLSLGTINQLLEPWAGAVLAKIMVLVLIILFIQKRPRGLFPQKGRAAEG